MLISFIFSYSENVFVVVYPSFSFILGQDPSAREQRDGRVLVKVVSLKVQALAQASEMAARPAWG